MPTIIIDAAELAGQSGLTLFLQNSLTGAQLDADGGALVENPANSGHFTADISGTVSVIHYGKIMRGSTPVRDGWVDINGTRLLDRYPIAVGGTTGSGQYQVKFIAQDFYNPANKIQGMMVTVQTTGGTNVAWGWTNIAGEVILNLDPGNQTFLYSADGYVSGTVATSVSANRTEVVELLPIGPVPPPSAYLSSVAVRVLKGATAVQNAIVKAQLVDPRATIPSGALVHTVSEFTSNSAGEGTLVLPYSSSILHGDGIYRITIQEPTTKEIFHTRDVTVPDVPSISYSSLPNA